MIETANDLERRMGLRSITEAIDTTTSDSRLIFHVFGALGQFERDLIRERIKLRTCFASPNRSPSAGFQDPHAVAGKQDGRSAAPQHELLTVQEIDQLAAGRDRSQCLAGKCDAQRR